MANPFLRGPAREMAARDVISWIVVIALPVSAPLTWVYCPAEPALVPLSACWKASKMIFCLSAEIPMPVSIT